MNELRVADGNLRTSAVTGWRVDASVIPAIDDVCSMPESLSTGSAIFLQPQGIVSLRCRQGPAPHCRVSSSTTSKWGATVLCVAGIEVVQLLVYRKASYTANPAVNNSTFTSLEETT